MSKLRDEMKFNMELKGFSPRTQKAYIENVKNFANYYSKSPDKLGTKEVREYLHYLITEKEVSKSYINSVYSGLKFFYETTLKRKWDMHEIPRVKKEKRLPVILSSSEVREIFDATINIKHRAILMTIYAAGLRVSEATNLKVEDIDSTNMQIRVRQGKGKKDRYTLLSKHNLQILRDYCKYYFIRDNWLFPGVPPENPITTRTIQKTFKNSKERAGIKKQATVHTLRHCFATHLLEAGINIYQIQQLLGHTSPRTTSVYIHLSTPDVLKVKSPLDLMEEI